MLFSESVIPEFVMCADRNVVHIHRYKQCEKQTVHNAYATEASGVLVGWLGVSCLTIIALAEL